MIDNDQENSSSQEELNVSESPKESIADTPECEKEDHGMLNVEDGPFQVCPLIQSLPSELEYTKFEAYNENIYLGTSTGDLLHYFEIEPRNYMLVSQTKFDPDATHPISNIILLPEIERALVLSNCTLVLFLLPEFAPAPNTLKLKGVIDVTLKSYSVHSNLYKVYAAQKEQIKLLKVSLNAITLAKSYDYQHIEIMRAQGHTLAVSKAGNYEIINLKTSGTIPLFRVSETDAPLTPVIAEFTQREFLIATGGASLADSSMALIVNHEGDIVNGTIVLENYPSAIIVNSPYIVVSFDEKGVFVYRMGDYSQAVQRITTNTSSLKIASTSKLFSKFKDNNSRHKVVEKLRKVSLIKDTNQIRTENERDHINGIFVESSSLAIYGKSGIHILLKRSPILDFTQFDEKYIDEINRFLMQNQSSHPSKFEETEREYLTTMMLLILSLHCRGIDEVVIKEWCLHRKSVDLRLLFYILGLDVFGDIWVPNGLMKPIEKVKSLKLIHKCSNVSHLLRTIKLEIDEAEGSSNISDEKVKTIDVNIFKQEVGQKEGIIDVSYYDQRSLEEITKILEKESDKCVPLLLDIFERRGMFLESLELMKEGGDFEKMIIFLKTNITKFPPDYVKEDLVTDLMLFIHQSKKLDANLVDEVIQVLAIANVNPRNLIARAGEDSCLKALIMENLGAQDPNDKQYLAGYYLANLQKTMQDNNLWDLIASFVSSYSHDMNYTKCSLMEFLMIKIKHDKKLEEFSRLFQNITALYKSDDDKRLLCDTIDQIEAFDINHTLTLLVLGETGSTLTFLTKGELLDVFMASNDFLNMEALLDRENIIKVLEHYVSLPNREKSAPLISYLLERNQFLIQNHDVRLSILNKLPVDADFNLLFSAIYCIIKKMEGQKRDLDLKKALLKNELCVNNNLLDCLNKEMQS